MNQRIKTSSYTLGFGRTLHFIDGAQPLSINLLSQTPFRVAINGEKSMLWASNPDIFNGKIINHTCPIPPEGTASITLLGEAVITAEVTLTCAANESVHAVIGDQETIELIEHYQWRAAYCMVILKILLVSLFLFVALMAFAPYITPL